MNWQDFAMIGRLSLLYILCKQEVLLEGNSAVEEVNIYLWAEKSRTFIENEYKLFNIMVG